jgi:hypothetical protein
MANTFDTTQLRRDIATTEANLQSLKERLAGIVRQCKMKGHSWSPVKYEPIEHKAYHFAGDPPGTMGIDRQLPFDVPASTTKQWSRTCLNCGEKETTQRTKKQYAAGSIPGTGGEVDVPDFGDYHWSDKPSSRRDW